MERGPEAGRQAQRPSDARSVFVQDGLNEGGVF